MKLLLDTHVWIWANAEPHRLHSRVADALDDPANELWLSVITFWEIMMLGQKRRMQFDPDPATWIRERLERHPVQEAAINRNVAILGRQIELDTEDPVDRLLAATAEIFELTLVTSDKRLLGCKRIQTLANG